MSNRRSFVVGVVVAAATIGTSRREARAQETAAPTGSAEPSAVSSPTEPKAAAREGSSTATPAPVAEAPPPAVVESAPIAASEPPLAAWHNGTFYVRDRSDNFRLYLQGRANVDAYVPFGPGVADLGPGTSLKPTIFLRRVRPEISGEFLRVWQFKIEGEWGQSAVDNANGQADTPTCTVDPASGAQTCTNRSAPVQAAAQKPQALDVFINWAPAPYFNLQVGQFKIPFTFENRTSENFTPFMEASLPVRAVGAPVNRDMGVMAWGESTDRRVYYSVGVFNGDGPNRPNPDSRFDGIGRVFGHPLAGLGTGIDDLQIGVSARYGVRDSTYVGYDYPSLTTQGGYAFWKPTYTDASGRLTHIIPSGTQSAFAAELVLPVSVLDVTGEVIFINNGTREAIDGYQLTPFTERLGTLKGTAYYAQVGVWVMGDRSLIGRRGYSTPTHVDLTKPSKTTFDQGLELLAKVEQVRLDYGGSARGGAPDAKGGADGDIKVDGISLGANYWATKHVRLTANYAYYSFPDSEPASASPKGTVQQGPGQRAVAPAQGLAKGVDDETRASGHGLHEIMFRLGVAL